MSSRGVLKSAWFQLLIGSLVLTPVGTGIYDWLKQRPILTTITTWLAAFWNGLTYVWNIQLALGYFVVGGLILVFGLIWLVRISIKATLAEPDFTSYKVDKFKDWCWSWSWWYNPTRKKWEVVDMEPYCEACQMQMLTRFDGRHTYYCPQCERAYDNYDYNSTFGKKWEEKNDIAHLILNKIAKKTYPNFKS